MLAHRWVPTADLVAWHGQPLFHSALTYTDFRVLRGLDITPLRRLSEWTFHNETSFPLYLEVHFGPADDGLSLTAQSRLDGHHTTAQRFLELVGAAIRSIAEGTAVPEDSDGGTR